MISYTNITSLYYINVALTTIVDATIIIYYNIINYKI